jgi:CRISPR locus-related DNA-binding protein
MSGTTLICTFYSFEPIVASATQYSPKRIILLVASDSLKKPEVRENIERAKSTYKNVVPVSVVETGDSDMLRIAGDTIKLIEAENGAGNSIVVNVSGGWKLLAQGTLYGCYAREGMVDKIICNDLSAEGRIVELPKLCFGLTKAKATVLGEIAKRDSRSMAEIAKKLGKTRAMIYQHLKELKENGYVDGKFEITLAGRLARL